MEQKPISRIHQSSSLRDGGIAWADFLADLDQRIAIADEAQRKADELRRRHNQAQHNTGIASDRKLA